MIDSYRPLLDIFVISKVYIHLGILMCTFSISVHQRGNMSRKMSARPYPCPQMKMGNFGQYNTLIITLICIRHTIKETTYGYLTSKYMFRQTLRIPKEVFRVLRCRCVGHPLMEIYNEPHSSSSGNNSNHETNVVNDLA